MSSQSKAQKRKSKKKYFMSSKKAKSSGLEPGMKGFLITCNDERRCVKEAYNLLNAFADEIYGPENEVTTNKSEDDYEDLEEQFEKEIAAIKSNSQRRFQQVSTKVKGILFINTTIPDPTSLVKKIYETVITSGKRRTRFIMRFKPVVATCKVSESDISKALQEILLQLPSEEKDKELKYKVESKVRHNDKITESHLLFYSKEPVKIAAPKWTPSIIDPDKMISFHVLRNVCCISILDKYQEYKKYNLSNVVQSVEDSDSREIVESVPSYKSIDEDDDDDKNTNEHRCEDVSEKPSEDASEKPSEDASEKSSEDASEKSSEDASEKPSEDASEKSSELASSENSKSSCEKDS